MKLKNLLVPIILLTILFISFYTKKEENYNTPCGSYEKGEIKILEITIKIDIADDDCKRELGLSGREVLKDNEGMIFIFDKVGSHGFWMKDMKFSIDILWIDDNLVIIGVERGVATSTYPEIFGQNYPSRYVLELPSGYFKENNIKVGNKIIFL